MPRQQRPCDVIAFDLDGTLVNTSGLHVAATQAAARAVFGEEVAPVLVTKSIGQPLQASMRLISNGREQIDALMTAFLSYYTMHESAGAQPFPEAIPTLQALHASGMPLALLSNKLRAWGNAEIVRLGLAPFFTSVIFMEDMPAPKPSALALQPLLKACKVAAKRVLVIGDGVGDVQCAHAAGAQSGAALWGPHDPAPLVAAHPTHTFYQMADILRLVEL